VAHFSVEKPAKFCAETNKIAIILNLSSHTVTAYLKTAMRKLDVSTRVQAVVMAYRLKLL
jgi:DNA-binding CsgD family transcriptional regulator